MDAGDSPAKGNASGLPVSVSAGLASPLLAARILDAPRCPGLIGNLDRFDIIGLIGEGGMGVVFLARDPRNSARVAIKVLRPELAREPRAVHRFLKEARHMSRLTHPHILKVLEVSERPEGPYFVLPLIEPGSLARLLKPGQPFDAAATLNVSQQMADALQYAHNRGIIHRDFKPGNVLLDQEGNAYLADFGLVRTIFNDSLVDVSQEQREGTAPYMSPAVAAGKAEDTRCDIYSFGAVLYELLTGQLPYEGRSADLVARKIRDGPPVPIRVLRPGAPPGLAQVAEGCMARDLRQRYAQMTDVLTDLQRLQRGQEPLGPHAVSLPTRWPDKKALVAMLACLCLVVVAVMSRTWPTRRAADDGVRHLLAQPAKPSPGPENPGTIPARALDIKSAHPVQTKVAPKVLWREDFATLNGWSFRENNGTFASNGKYAYVDRWGTDNWVIAEKNIPKPIGPGEPFGLAVRLSTGPDEPRRLGAVSVSLIDSNHRTVAKVLWCDVQAGTGFGGVDFYAAGAPIYNTDPRGFGTEYAQFSGVLGLTRAGMQWTAYVDGLQKGPTLTLTPNVNIELVRIEASYTPGWEPRELHIYSITLTDSVATDQAQPANEER